MTPAQLTEARRWVALRGWRWMPGMMADWTHRRRGVCGDMMPVQRARVILGLVAEPVSRADVVCMRDVPRDALPDVTDPATRGCLLALTEQISGEPWRLPLAAGRMLRWVEFRERALSEDQP